MDTVWDEQSIQETARGFMKPAVLLSMIDLDLFSTLAETPARAVDVASSSGLDPRGTRILLDAASALGLVIKEDDQYRVEPSVVDLLSSKRPETLYWMLKHMTRLYRNWARLPEAVRTGKPVQDAPISESSRVQKESFIRAMHRIAKPAAEELIEQVGIGPARHLLDAGGGPGTYTAAALRRAPDLKATLFDLPHAIEIARGYLKEGGLEDRVEFVVGDFYTDTLPPDHDLAFLFAVIHMNSPDENKALYRKVHDALVPGGRLVIRDHIMDETRTCPPEGAIFAVNMLVNTEGGDTYPFEQIKAELEASGFADVNFKRQGDRPMSGLVEAWKRA